MTSRWCGAQRHYDEQEWAIEKLDPGWAKASLFFRSGCVHHFVHGAEARSFQSLPDIAAALAGHQRRFKAGNAIELLHAVEICATENLPLPTWVALGFKERFGSYLKPGGPLTLDETFPEANTVMPMAKAEKARRDWVIGSKIFTRMHEHGSEHTAFSPALKAAVTALDLGVSLTRARELVKEIEQVHIDKDPHYKPFSHFWPERRKRSE